MMTFIIMTLSFTVAILLSAVLSFMLMTHPKVMKWYMNYIIKIMSRMDQFVDDQTYKGL
jgi:ABC-type amino acid transport system permease subunit